MANATNEVDEIRRRMAQIRMELHEDVQGVVAGTEAAFDWQYYVRLYPWAALAGAVVVGYLVVPKKRRPHNEHADSEPSSSRLTHGPKHEVTEEKHEARRKSGLLGLAFGFVGPIVMRAAQNYASHYVENWIQQQNFAGPSFETEPGTHPGSGWPAGPAPGGPHPG